jgi:hypothetical protein
VPRIYEIGQQRTEHVPLVLYFSLSHHYCKVLA